MNSLSQIALKIDFVLFVIGTALFQFSLARCPWICRRSPLVHPRFRRFRDAAGSTCI